MQEEHPRPRRFAGMGRKVSLFFVTAVFGLIGVVLLVSYKQGAFVRHTKLHFYAADVQGISSGMAVKLFGLPVGSVSDMEIRDRGIRVELSIISDYAPRLPKGSRARLTREGYIGAANIQLVPNGDPGREPGGVAQGDEIEFIPARGVAELVDEFKNQLAPVISDLRKLVAEMNQPNGDFRRSVEGASTLLQQLPETNRELRQVLRDTDHAMLAVGRQAEAAFASAARVSAQIEHDLPLLTGKVAASMDSVSAAAAQVRDTTRKNGDALHEVLVEIPGLLRDGTDFVREGQDIAVAARNSWLFRDMIEAKPLRTLPLDSFESSGAGPVAVQVPH